MITTVDTIRPVDKQKVIVKIKQYLKEQLPYWEVEYNIVYEDFSKLQIDEELFTECYKTANAAMVEELSFSAENIMLSHAKRYEHIYNRNRYPKNKQGKDVQAVPKLVNHYITAMDALRRKERVLGITYHNSTNILAASFETSVRDYSQDVKGTNFDPRRLNIEQLTTEEKMEMLALLQKARIDTTEDEANSITVSTKVVVRTGKVGDEIDDREATLNTNTSDVVVEDVDHEEVFEEDQKMPLNSLAEINKNEADKLDKKIRREKMLQKLSRKKKK